MTDEKPSADSQSIPSSVRGVGIERSQSEIRGRLARLERAYETAYNPTDAAITLARIEELRWVLGDDRDGDVE